MKPIFKITLLLMAATAFSTFGCTQNTGILDETPNNPAMDVKTYGNLEFIYQVTDMEGNPQRTFREGENFIISFVVKNHGEEDKMIFDRWWFPEVTDNFLAVYKRDNQGEVLIGKSFKIGGNTYDASGQGVPGQSKIIYQIPWLTRSDTTYIMPIYRPERNIPNKRSYLAVEPLPESLPSGEYYSRFTFDFKDKEISFAITFAIE